MEPQSTPPVNQNPTPAPTPPASDKRKAKLLIAIAIAILVIAAGVIIYLLLQPKNDTSNNQTGNKNDTNNGPTVLTFGTEAQPITYAGNKVIDACNLLAVSTLKKHVEKYDESIKNLGTKNFLKAPLVVDHGYFDRSLAQPRGGDGEPRSTGVIVGGDSIETSHQASSFTSNFDNNCKYGQGDGFDTVFAEVYVTQKPTPLSSDLIKYLDKLKADGRLVKEVSGLQVYVEPPRDANFTFIIRKSDTVVTFTSPFEKLAQAAAEEISTKLLSPVTGPLTVTFPAMYNKMANPCRLITAEDFEHLTKLEVSAQAEERIYLTEIERDTAQRECTRVETMRRGTTEISSIDVTLSQSRNEEAAKKRLEALKNTENVTLTPVSEAGYGDESYIKTRELVSTNYYSMVMRIGSVMIEVNYDSEEGKAKSLDAYKQRILPVAKTAIERFNAL
ncbi:MAG TPA: hypothetical protein VD907_03265 [Verrucomicrobiae bacterium]|nr:hypothetical protein [Verrucomicrobiae bacterium]